jgi:protein phosphatase
VREINQDRVYFRGSVAALADGMGGHQGGERAAELAIGEFRIVRSELSQAELVDVVEEANRQVHQQAVNPDLRGMGTTVVALGLHKDNSMTVVNVGDSRAYWLRDDTLVQVTEDHSFVEDLVRQGRLSPDEAQLHPQRNILTRALGIADEVMVDRFELEPEVGDRFLLCSDGLFNEVDLDDIGAILLEHEDPSEAADHLVAAALTTPCRDNVTVAVVSVVEDDHPAVVGTEPDHGIDLSPPEKITAQLPIVTNDVVKITDRPDGGGGKRSGSGGVDTLVAEAETPRAEPERRRGAAERATDDRVGDTAKAKAGGDGSTNGTAAGMRMVRTTTTAERAEPMARRAAESKPAEFDTELDRRRRRWWPAVAVVLLAGLAAAGYVGAERYNDSLYHVSAVDGELVIFHGHEGGLLWIEPVAEERTGRFVDDLTEASRATLDGWDHFPSLRDAQLSVDNLEIEQERIVGADGAEQPPGASAGAGSTNDQRGGGDNADSQGG